MDFEEFLHILQEVWVCCRGVWLFLHTSTNVRIKHHYQRLCHNQTFSRDHPHDRLPRDLSPDERLAIKNFISSHEPCCPSKIQLETLSRFRLYTITHSHWSCLWPKILIMQILIVPIQDFARSSMFHRSYIKD